MPMKDASCGSNWEVGFKPPEFGLYGIALLSIKRYWRLAPAPTDKLCAKP
jgi:hypothetical protein